MMSQLFVELYLDEDVSVIVARMLRSRAFTAVTTQEADQVKNSGSEQLAYAIRQNKTLLTHNRLDFERLSQDYFRTNSSHKGMIIAIRRAPSEVVGRLLVVLDRVTADEMDNQMIYI